MNHSALVLVPENRFAHAAAVRLLDPANHTVPIVTIYGPSGVGKSQVARKIARQALAENPQRLVVQLTAAELSVELAKASASGMISEFQATYRCLNLLICEDIQTLEKRPETQAQLLAIINEIVAGGGRVLLTCHRPPGELKGLCPKLVNRCHGGVCGEIEMPSPGTRAVLLQEFAEGRGILLKDHWVQKLARRVDGTPRELMGTVVQLQMLAASRQTCIDDAIVSEFVNQLHQTTGPTLPEITRKVAAAFEVSISEIREGGRGQAIVLPRQVAMYLARVGGKQRFKDIGEYFGGRSHSTVVHACQQMNERLRNDPRLFHQVERINHALRLPKLPEGQQLVDEL